MSKKEFWKDIKGFEGIYQISNMGNVRSLKRKVKCGLGERTIKESPIRFTVRSGYYNVNLRKQGQRVGKQIHRLVAETFLPNPLNLPIVNHKDNNPKNNCVKNLEWCTQKHNVIWSKTKMCKPKKIMHSSTKEKYIYKRGKKYRVCISRFNVDKTFGLLKDAISFRNQVIESEKEYFTR
jgi:hypothetical protein